MKLGEIQIQNFRAFNDESIRFDDYACLVVTCPPKTSPTEM
jgi:predicted ATP-dependent endonuclease of OLD family